MDVETTQIAVACSGIAIVILCRRPENVESEKSGLSRGFRGFRL